ncbi:MAG TPA: DUF2723 domain-containing protein [Anaerolineae bacterium]|nr:DUF2723 domain-containing protein [Anaerolineae bacterium]
MKTPNLWRYWLPLLALGVFISRCLYEINPIQFASLADWLNVLFVMMGTLIVARLVLSLARRRLAGFPPDLSPFLILLVYVIWPQVDLLWALVLLVGVLLLIAARYVLPRARWFDVALGVIVLAIYLITLGDHVGQADTFEFQVVAPQLGIAHPTGYPLFIGLGKLFSLLPLGSMAWRVNLASAIFAMIAVWLIYRTIVALTSDRLVAALAAIALAASPVFWSQAVVAEVYALNALFVAAILLLAVSLLASKSEIKNQRSKIYLLFFLFGLAFSHHLTSVILIPAIGITFALVRPKLSVKSWLVAIGLFLLGLTPWLFIYLRWPALHNGQGIAIGEWLTWIFGLRFGGALNLSSVFDPTRWSIVTRMVLEQFGWAGAALSLLGLIVLIKRAWRVALILAVTFTGYIFYGLVYNVPDVDVFIIPAFMIMAVWIGAAFGFVVEQVSARSDAWRITPYAARSALYLLFALLPLWQIAGNFDTINQRGLNADREAWGRYVLSLPIPQKAALLVDSEKIAPLYYLQVTENIRPDLDIEVLGDEALYRQELDRRVSDGQPVYLARFLPNLPYRMHSLGPLVEVTREPSSTVPTIGHEINATLGDQIELLGIDENQGSPYRFTLYWQALTPERKNYHVRLRLIDAQGNIWWEDSGAHPVGGYYPTGAWAQNEVVSDFHEIEIEPFLLPGTYDLEVGLFTPFRPDGLKTADGGEWLKVGSIQVITPRSEPLAHEVRMSYGPTALLSLDELGTVPPESQVSLRLQAAGATEPASLALINERNVFAVYTQTLRAGQTRFAFPAPEFEGQYQLWMATGQPAHCHWLSDVANSCELGTLTVAGDAIGDAINFDNQVQLLGSKIDRDMVKPGETVKVELTWRGLKSWLDNYTAFVHLLGPDGKVHGQVDQWPVQGTLPTSSWTAGQVVDDPYAITLPPDAPSGKYQVEVGWYLLSTLRRLNVLDGVGRPSDDRVIVGEFTVP